LSPNADQLVRFSNGVAPLLINTPSEYNLMIPSPVVFIPVRLTVTSWITLMLPSVPSNNKLTAEAILLIVKLFCCSAGAV